jgi:hypothetical protein
LAVVSQWRRSNFDNSLGYEDDLMRDTVKFLRLVFSAIAFFAFGIGQVAADGTFPGLLQPGQVLGNNGTSAAPAGPIPGRIQQTAAGAYWVNGNSSSSAACGSTGASTCNPGSDSNNCLTPATACLTLQHVYNLTTNKVDLAGFGVAVFLAHGTSPNYSLVCENGPQIGSATISVFGDTTAPTAVTIQVPTGAGQDALAFKDGCTIGFISVAWADNAAGNGGNFINGGSGFGGHLDLTNVSFGTINGGNGVALGLSYSGITVSLNGCAITGNMGAFANVVAGATLDMSGGVCTGSSNLTFSIAFALYSGGGTILAAASSFSGFSGITGARCAIDGPIWFATNPNAIFPGSSNCTATIEVGAIGVQNNAGPNINYGNSGQPLLSSGGGPNQYGTLGPTGGGTGVTTAPANQFFGGPVSGSAAAPGLRALVGADLPNPSASTLGGIESITQLAHNWVAYIDPAGVPHQSQPATTDLSDVAAPTSWTPADASGAGLTLTSTDTFYTKIGKVCVVSFYIAWPSTSDMHNAQISGLPAACAARNGSTNYVAGGIILGTGDNIAMGMAVLATNGQNLFIWGSTGGLLTNANMSGSGMRGTITYLSN